MESCIDEWKRAVTVANVLWKNFFCRFGFPARSCQLGPQFRECSHERAVQASWNHQDPSQLLPPTGQWDHRDIQQNSDEYTGHSESQSLFIIVLNMIPLVTLHTSWCMADTPNSLRSPSLACPLPRNHVSVVNMSRLCSTCTYDHTNSMSRYAKDFN